MHTDILNLSHPLHYTLVHAHSGILPRAPQPSQKLTVCLQVMEAGLQECRDFDGVGGQQILQRNPKLAAGHSFLHITGDNTMRSANWEGAMGLLHYLAGEKNLT